MILQLGISNKKVRELGRLFKGLKLKEAIECAMQFAKLIKQKQSQGYYPALCRLTDGDVIPVSIPGLSVWPAITKPKLGKGKPTMRPGAPDGPVIEPKSNIIPFNDKMAKEIAEGEEA